MKVKDHKGNEFESIKEMCGFYGVNYNTYKHRRERGISLELSLSKTNLVDHKVKDHKGNEFESIKEMCEFYGISYNNYLLRKLVVSKKYNLIFRNRSFHYNY